MRRNTVNVFKALSDPNRIRILKILEVKELCLCEIREVLGLSASTVSKHLSLLRDADLIQDSKDGRWVNFRLNGVSESALVRSQLALVRKSFADEDQVVSDRKKLLKVDRRIICGV